LEFAVALANGVSKETEGCGVAGNTPVVLDDAGRALPDRVEQFPTAIMAVDLPADAVAGLEVAWGGRSDAIPGHHVVDGRALAAGEWFADVVTELGIDGERTHVIAGLYQAHTREILLRGAMMDVLHQLPPDRCVLDSILSAIEQGDPRAANRSAARSLAAAVSADSAGDCGCEVFATRACADARETCTATRAKLARATTMITLWVDRSCDIIGEILCVGNCGVAN
jgi:hypothetical protein